MKLYLISSWCKLLYLQDQLTIPVKFFGLYMLPRQVIPMFAVELFPHELNAFVNLQNTTHIFWEEQRKAEGGVCWICFPVRTRYCSHWVEGSVATLFPGGRLELILAICYALDCKCLQRMPDTRLELKCLQKNPDLIFHQKNRERVLLNIKQIWIQMPPESKSVMKISEYKCSNWHYWCVFVGFLFTLPYHEK